jgi:hypothetical protein
MDSSILVQLRQAQELQSGTASWIGIDVHKRSYSIAVQVGILVNDSLLGKIIATFVLRLISFI